MKGLEGKTKLQVGKQSPYRLPQNTSTPAPRHPFTSCDLPIPLQLTGRCYCAHYSDVETEALGGQVSAQGHTGSHYLS